MAAKSSRSRPKSLASTQCSGRLCVVETVFLVVAAELLLAQGVLAVGSLLQGQHSAPLGAGVAIQKQVPDSSGTGQKLQVRVSGSASLQGSQESLPSGLSLTYSAESRDFNRKEGEAVLALPSSREQKQVTWTWGIGGSLSVPGVLTGKDTGRGSKTKRVGGRKVALPQELGEGEEFLDLLVHHASAIYVEDTTALAAWNCTRCSISPVNQFQLTSLIIDKEAMLEAYVGIHHDKQMVVVCFRGTHSTYIKNWIDDLWALQLDMNFPGVEHALVHRGFYYAYHKSTLKPRVSEEVLRLLAANPSYPVAITGHSLGAALASFCGLDLVLNFDVPQERVWLATFGSPRVGNPVFAQYFKMHLPYSVRVTHGRDIVVHLPPHTPYSGLLGYHHVAQELWYHRTSFFASEEVSQACDESGEDLTCSRSVGWTSLVDHLKYLGVPLC